MNWKAIPGWPLYEASGDGRIRNRNTERTLKPRARDDGYTVVDLYRAGDRDGETLRRIRKTIGVHILVCMAFKGPRPSGNHEAAHKNGRKNDNRGANLRWATRIENENDKRSHGTAPVGERNAAAKISQNQALSIFHDTRPATTIAADYGINRRTVTKIKLGQRWRHLHAGKTEVAA